MKTLLTATIAAIVTLASTFAAVASPVTAAVALHASTSVAVDSGDPDNPLVLAAWETPDAGPSQAVPPTQINPPGKYDGTSQVCFWAVAYNSPIQSLSQVAAEVSYPDQPLLGDPPAGNTFAFEVIMAPYSDALADGQIDSSEAGAAITEFDNAASAGLVTLQTPPYHDNETIDQMLAKGEAYLWTGSYAMEYYQPAGIYTARFWAKNVSGNDPLNDLTNSFEYVAAAAFEVDFQSVDYGHLSANTDGSAYGAVIGDSIFDNSDSRPTLRNIGNTWFQLQIEQDDMGFGTSQSGGAWNVTFDARIGDLVTHPPGGGVNTFFDPAFSQGPTSPDPAKWTTLPGVVHLRDTWEMDFSIDIVKCTGDSYGGSMWLQPEYVAFNGPEAYQMSK